MTLKQFLKPNLKKIIIFVIFLIILFQYFPLPSTSLCEKIVCPDNQYYHVSWEPGCLRCGDISWNEQLLSTYYYQIMFTSFVILYLLSSLIVWIYDKVRKRK
jgi:hypothetical protein